MKAQHVLTQACMHNCLNRYGTEEIVTEKEVHTISVVAASIWQAIVRLQIRVYNFRESPSRIPTKDAATSILLELM